ncbi:MAG: ACP phosphodiesterase [Bacteroidota bacterium]|nr:ACP phosphodiesterase [Bacteroidota bacterium]
MAHLYLSGESEGIRIGNFIGDFVKGRKFNDYPLPIANGIMLHRKIDHFTDTNQLTLNSKRLFSSAYRHYSGIIIDMVYDHFLARNWSEYSSYDLDEYLDQFYQSAYKYWDYLPEEMKSILPKIIANQRIQSYQTLQGVQDALFSMSQYTSLPNHTSFALDVIHTNYMHLEEQFKEFFEEVKKQCDIWLMHDFSN